MSNFFCLFLHFLKFFCYVEKLSKSQALYASILKKI